MKDMWPSIAGLTECNGRTIAEAGWCPEPNLGRINVAATDVRLPGSARGGIRSKRPASAPEVSQRYDDHLRGDEAETVDFLAGLAGGGSALELAIGTGRIAIPLTQRGVRVDGIELSPDMVARIRAKPDGDKVDVTVGDMASASAPCDRYPLVYLVFNTIYNILTQDGQVRCFENAARHLSTGGVFVVEAGVPSAWLRGDQFVNVEHLGSDEVVLDVNRYDAPLRSWTRTTSPSLRTGCGSGRSRAGSSGRPKWI